MERSVNILYNLRGWDYISTVVRFKDSPNDIFKSLYLRYTYNLWLQ